eukprot:9810027-Karenia_brevis.AAC.1
MAYIGPPGAPSWHVWPRHDGPPVTWSTPSLMALWHPAPSGLASWRSFACHGAPLGAHDHATGGLLAPRPANKALMAYIGPPGAPSWHV